MSSFRAVITGCLHKKWLFMLLCQPSQQLVVLGLPSATNWIWASVWPGSFTQVRSKQTRSSSKRWSFWGKSLHGALKVCLTSEEWKKMQSGSWSGAWHPIDGSNCCLSPRLCTVLYVSSTARSESSNLEAAAGEESPKYIECSFFKSSRILSGLAKLITWFIRVSGSLWHVASLFGRCA